MHDRIEASENLRRALLAASEKIVAQPERGLPAPRPYPYLGRLGFAWIKSGRYWIAYRTRPRPVIMAVFYESADIPGRM